MRKGVVHMDNILKLIDTELMRISQELSVSDETVEFYKEFKKSNLCSSVHKVCEYNHVDLATALIMCKETDLDINFVHNALSKAERFIDLCGDENVFSSIFEFLDTFIDMGIYQDVIDVLSKEKGIGVFSLFKKSTLYIKAFNDCLNKYKINASDFVDFMKLYRSYRTKVFDSFLLIREFKNFGKEVEESEENAGLLSIIFPSKSKYKKRYIDRCATNKWGTNVLLVPVREAINYGQSLEARELSRKRLLKDQKNAYEELSDKLSASLKGGEISNFMELISKIPNERIRLEVLKLVYLHNMEIYDSMKKEHDSLSGDDSTQYRILLSDNGISCDNCNLSLVRRNSLSDVSTMISILSSLGITDSTLIFNILKVSDLSVVRWLNSICQCGIINSDLLKSHSDLFDETSSLFNTFNSNIEFLKEMNINPKCFNNSSSSLIIPTEVFKNNILTLKDYSLLSSFKSDQDYSFLGSRSLHVVIDTLLELGFESFLVDDLSILNYQDRFKRLRFLKELNIPINCKDDLMNVLKTDRFYVKDEDIASYLYNAASYSVPNVKRCRRKQENDLDLEEFSDGERIYNFNGVLISKNKVKRNSYYLNPSSSIMDRRLFCILQGSILSDYDVECIMSALGIEKEDSFVKKIEV